MDLKYRLLPTTLIQTDPPPSADDLTYRRYLLRFGFLIIFAATAKLHVIRKRNAAFKSSYVPTVFTVPADLKIALLMSFPNSGTSYTLRIVGQTSELATATTYCGEGEDGIKSLPIFNDTKSGPNFHHLHRGLPEKFVLTKTHCHGKCNDCPPSKYNIKQEKFQSGCLTQCINNPVSQKREKRPYNPDLIGKAVHLFRSPFDNIISRFHLHMRHAVEKHRPDENRTIDFEGFDAYCKDQDDRYVQEEATTIMNGFHDNVLTVAPIDGVPCHGEFFRYVQWHNLAFETTQRMNTSTYILHYQDYHDDFEGTLHNLMDFLELPIVSKGSNFFWNDYSEYYSYDQRRAIKAYLKELASEETWNEIERYFG